MTNAALGVDVGGVIIGRTTTTGQAELADRNAAEVPGALDALRLLVDRGFGDAVFVISKCGPRVQAKILRWLKDQRFHEVTGVKPNHVRFCLERREKLQICSELGITHFIDDRLDVLMNLRQVPHLYLFAPDDRRAPVHLPRFVERVRSWQEVVARLIVGPTSGPVKTGR